MVAVIGVAAARAIAARMAGMAVRDGRDHHLDSACLVAGAGIAGGKVIGATSDDTFSGQPIDPATGAVDPDGVPVRPADVHATILTAMGLGIEHISNQDPVIIDAMLAG
jgi:hypothetical protein